MKAEYVDHFGDDLRVVNAARVSFDKESDWDFNEYLDPLYGDYTTKVELSKKDEKLINYLASHNHWTPFSHCAITLRETVPIFVARQRFKHMVGFTYNEVSRRYVDDTPEFFDPKELRLKSENKKQGSEGPHPQKEYWRNQMWNSFEHAKNLYEEMVNDGVAPEQARMVLPQSMCTSYYVTGSLYAFARAYKLRSDPHAQKEIQDLAVMWDSVIRPLFPISWSALVDL